MLNDNHEKQNINMSVAKFNGTVYRQWALENRMKRYRWPSKFKSVSDRQDVGALMCSVFIYLDLHYYCICVFCIFYLAAFKRHYALRVAIAPEFLYCSYMCLFYVYALGC